MQAVDDSPMVDILSVLTQVLQAINLYSPGSISQTVTQYWIMANKGPSILDILLDDALLNAMDKAMTTSMETDLLKIYFRVAALLPQSSMEKAVIHLSESAKVFYPSSVSKPEVSIKQLLIRRPYLFILSTFELLSTEQLLAIRINPSKITE